MKHTIFLLINLLPAFHIIAQISPQKTGNPPDLLCVRNESSNKVSIQWTGATDPGSCFSNYGVYIAIGDKNGTYHKIDSISHSGDGILVFDPQTQANVYVFLVNEQNCLNPAISKIVTSDTLDSKVPQEAPYIERVSVENNHPVVYWTPYKNKEVSDYAIFSNANAFNTPIDTVKGRTSNSYTDSDHDASVESGVYKVRSIEYCEDSSGLFSNITEAYNTINLTREEEDLCKRSVVINWNGYNNHNEGVIAYRIDYSNSNTGTFTPKDTLEESVRTYDFKGLIANQQNCIRVVALLPNGHESWSNVVCLNSQSVAPVDFHYISNIYVKDDHVELIYHSDNSADIQDIALERSANGNVFQVLSSGVSIGNPNPQGVYTIQDFSALTNRSSLYYRVAVKNACQDKFNTLPAKTIFLKGENLGMNNELQWDNLEIDNDIVSNYNLYRIANSDTVLIHSTNNDGAYTDKNVYTNNTFSQTCYYIEADHFSTDTNRTGTTYYSGSNTVCLQPTPQAFIPNAFSPEGHNRIFRPILVFSSDDNYILKIFDRNGNKIFESNKPHIGWDGSYNGKTSALDTYTYHLEFMGLDGQKFERNGFVILVR